VDRAYCAIVYFGQVSDNDRSSPTNLRASISMVKVWLQIWAIFFLNSSGHPDRGQQKVIGHISQWLLGAACVQAVCMYLLVTVLFK
jgi:hypothetical protein